MSETFLIETLIKVGYFFSLGILFFSVIALAFLFIKSKHEMNENIPEGIEFIFGVLAFIALIALIIFRELIKHAAAN